MEQLKPCPFCGGEAEMRPWKYNGHDRYDFSCGHCGCSFIAGTCETEEEAIAKWNARAERTCHMKQDGMFLVCSECGVVLMGNPRYCSRCGARVLSEEEQGHMVADAIRRLEKARGL